MIEKLFDEMTFSSHCSLLQTVPSPVLDKGKAIADAYRTPSDPEDAAWGLGPCFEATRKTYVNTQLVV